MKPPPLAIRIAFVLSAAALLLNLIKIGCSNYLIWAMVPLDYSIVRSMLIGTIGFYLLWTLALFLGLFAIYHMKRWGLVLLSVAFILEFNPMFWFYWITTSNLVFWMIFMTLFIALIHFRQLKPWRISNHATDSNR